MISVKTNKELELMSIAGKINHECHEVLSKNIKAGIKTLELNNIAEAFIRKKNGIPSFLGYEGFPGAICISINDEVVHGIPNKRTLRSGDIVSIDIGVLYKGFHSDSARTYIVGVTKNKKHEILLKATKEALYKGMGKIHDGARIKDISAAIHEVADKYKLGVIRELVGHGVGKELHEEPDVPNFRNKDDTVLKEGMTIAIEPMFTLGKKDVEILENDWTIVTKDGSMAAHYEHTVVVTKDGYRILTGE